MRYHIFGGKGFVGQALANALRERSVPYLLYDNSPATSGHIHIDIRDQQALATLDAEPTDIVVNLAANQYHGEIPRDAREFFFGTNATGARNVLD